MTDRILTKFDYQINKKMTKNEYKRKKDLYPIDSEWLTGFHNRLLTAFDVRFITELKSKIEGYYVESGKEKPNLDVYQHIRRQLTGEHELSLQLVLLVSDMTGYSIHWLLKEEGPETVAELQIAAGKFDLDKIREEAVETYEINLMRAIKKGDFIERKERKAKIAG